MHMNIRKAELANASSIAVLSIEVWTGTYLRYGIGAFFADYILTEFTPSRTRALINDPQQNIWVAAGEDGIFGVVRLSSQATGPAAVCSDWEIATLYVQPRHHGKGIGKLLLDTAITHAHAHGAPSVWLITNSENTPAIEFYLARGFRQIGETHFRIADERYLNNLYVYAGEHS